MEWTGLHDLALIYLSLTHGADADLDAAEMEAMSVKLNEWKPGEQFSLIRRVLNDVLLVYTSPQRNQMLETAIASVGEDMSRSERVAVLNDLADIASADGIIVGGEISFIQTLAKKWGVEGEAS